MTIKPFGDRILVKPFESTYVLKPEDGALSEYGEVIAVGPDIAMRQNPRIKVGDKVGFSVFGVEKLVIDDEKYFFLQDSPEFLLCTIED